MAATPWKRLRSDFQFAILALFCASALAAIVPFTVYRFASGQWLAGWIDAGLVATLAGGLAWIWRGGDPRVVAVPVMALCGIGCVLIARAIGPSGMLWMYPLIVANYLVVSRRVATALSVAAVLAFIGLGDALAGTVQAAAFAATSLLVGVFSFLFAHRAERHRLELETLASHDPLTGALNRRGMLAELRVAAANARRTGAPVGVAVLDIDHFKRVNDVHGHEAGDRVLVDFVRLALAQIRAGDRLFRLGGEEFLLLLPGAGVDTLRRPIVLIREAIAAGLRCGDARVTVSIGAAALRPDEDIDHWLARADAALYRAKRGGRDRVVIDDEDGAAATERA